MDSMTDTGKAKANTVSTDAADMNWSTSTNITVKKIFYTGPFVPSPSFVIPSNHTADDLLKRAVSQR